MTAGAAVLDHRMEMNLSGCFVVVAHVAEAFARGHQFEGFFLAGMFFPCGFMADGALLRRHRPVNEAGFPHDGVTLGGDATVTGPCRGNRNQNGRDDYGKRYRKRPFHLHELPRRRKSIKSRLKIESAPP